MKLPSFAAIVLAVASAAAPLIGAENPVLFWNEQVLDATRLSRNPPPVAALHLATFHAAIFDTVDGIVHKWHPWLVQEKAPADANLDAAIASAAHVVLVTIWGEEVARNNFDHAFREALAPIPEGKAKEDGLAWGREVAKAVLANRAKSGFNAPATGVYESNAPGKWRPTPPAFRPPVTPQVAHVTPFVIESPSQFRAPPPHPLDSKTYAEELAYVNRVGPRDNADRTEYQTMSTPFWADALGTATPAGHWNMIAQDLARRNHLSVPDTARLFALLNFACADAGITCWDTKYHYSVWRPETALREIRPQDNKYATKNPDFIPNMPSPAFPSYTSAHTCYTSAAGRILALYFGTDDITFSVGSDGLPGAVRTFHKFSDAVHEIGMSRIWGGIHTPEDVFEALKQGPKVGDWVYTHALLPMR
jgi:PAP2 superfamily